MRSARAEVRYAPDTSPLGALTVSFPNVRSDRDVSRLAQEVFALPGQLADARRRKVVVALDEFQAIGRLQRRLGRARDARRRAASARRRLRVRRVGAEPDGADARAAAAVLQGRSGDAAREDPGRTSSRPSSTGGSTDRASSRKPASAPRSSSSPATCPTTFSASPTKPGTKCVRPAAARDARRSAPGAAPAAHRAAKRCSRRSGSA